MKDSKLENNNSSTNLNIEQIQESKNEVGSQINSESKNILNTENILISSSNNNEDIN